MVPAGKRKENEEDKRPCREPREGRGRRYHTYAHECETERREPSRTRAGRHHTTLTRSLDDMYAKYHLPRQRPPGPHTRHARTELQCGFGTLRLGSTYTDYLDSSGPV